MSGSWTGQGMGNLMQECVKNCFVWAVLGIIASYLDAFQAELASTKTTLGTRKTEGPTLQAMLAELPACDTCQFLQIHTLFPKL